MLHHMSVVFMRFVHVICHMQHGVCSHIEGNNVTITSSSAFTPIKTMHVQAAPIALPYVVLQAFVVWRFHG